MSGRRVPKGRFGASILDGMLEIDIDVPTRLALKLDEDKIARFAGNRVARTIRNRMRAGMDGDGGAAHQPRDGQPFKGKEGSLLRSIRYDRTTGVVKAESRRTRGDKEGGERVRTNFAVMSVHIADGRWRDPMGSEDPKQREQILRDVETELQKQLDKGALHTKGRGRQVGRRGGRRR